VTQEKAKYREVEFNDIVKLRNPEMEDDKYVKKVRPIEVVGDFFIYLDTPSDATEQVVRGACYAVAHLKKGVVIWSYFRGITHALEFAEFMNTGKRRINFMHGRHRKRIREKLVELGYLPLTKK